MLLEMLVRMLHVCHCGGKLVISSLCLSKSQEQRSSMPESNVLLSYLLYETAMGG